VLVLIAISGLVSSGAREPKKAATPTT